VYIASVKSGSSSVGSELLWLGLFLVIFVAIALAMNFLVVARTHFNDRIAIALSAIFAAAVWIVLRGRAMKR